MTKKEKINWLAKATASEFLAHYNSTHAKYVRLSLMDPNFQEVMEDWELTQAEMVKRLEGRS